MIECRYCREVLHTTPDKAGARCPSCRMPLFERQDKRRPPGYDLGPCAFHADTPAYSKCRRCNRLVCNVCRTRWHEQIVCPACLSGALESGEPSPRELSQQRRGPVWSLLFALFGWLLLLAGIFPFRILLTGGPSSQLATTAGVLFLGSLLPAVFAVGLAASALRTRKGRLRLATWSMTLAGLHVGLVLGLMVVNVWHN
jgi:hypothetical protein